jgi:hypothetical protein
MVVSVDADGAVAGAGRACGAGAQHGPGDGSRPPSPGAARGTRRDVVGGLAASAAALAIAPLVVASRPRPRRRDEPPADLAFDEVYRGRRIHGVPAGAASGAVGTGEWHVTVDGRPLHLMRRADGGWLSMVDHYRSYPTPLEAARAAVDELGPGQQLHAPAAAGSHEGGRGGHHGVHA